jgi:hypothetical protein
MGRLVEGYLGDARQDLPIGGYAALAGAFVAIFGSLLALASARRALPRRIAVRDTVLLGVATHKLTRVVTRDWVTIPLRFPFTRYEASDGGGEVRESARGRGLRRAVGDLLTCAFCAGPWVASALTAALVARPRATRAVASVLAAVTVSDFLHQAYQRARR